MNANPLIRGAAAFMAFAAAGALIGTAALPGGYVLLWAFHHFLIDDVFTGNLPAVYDMAAFCFFFGSALLTWAITLIVLLGTAVRILNGIRRGSGLKHRIDEFARGTVIPLLPFSWPETLYSRLSD